MLYQQLLLYLIKYWKDELTMLAVVSAVREVDFHQINYATNNTYQHVYLNNILKREKSIVKDLITNGYGASSSGDLFSTIYWDLPTQYLDKETKGTVCPFHSGYIKHPYNNKNQDANKMQDKNISQVVEKLIKKLLMVIFMQWKFLETFL